MVVTTKYLSGGRIQGASTDVAEANTSWKQLAKHTLENGATNIEVSGIAQKDNLWVLVSMLDVDASLYINFGINAGSASTDTDDTGKWSWAGRYANQGSDSTSTGDVKLLINNTQNGNGGFWNLRINNDNDGTDDRQKFAISRGCERNDIDDATDLPLAQDFAGKFNRTDGYIDRIKLTSQLATGDGSVTFPAGSEIVVLGCNNDEADSGTPFWQQLTNYELTSAGGIDTGASSIAEKKYLMIEVFYEDQSSSQTANVTFNNDTDPNYAYAFRRGSSYDDEVDQSSLVGIGSSQSGDKHSSILMDNISGYAKIGVFAGQQGSSAGSAGPRQIGAWKYVPSSLTDFISRIAISGTAGSGSTVRIWGGTP